MKEKIEVLNGLNEKTDIGFFAGDFIMPFQPLCRIGHSLCVEWCMKAQRFDGVTYIFRWEDDMCGSVRGWVEVVQNGLRTPFFGNMSDGRPVLTRNIDVDHDYSQGKNAVEQICEDICGGEEKFMQMAKFVQSDDEWSREFV